jgi:hypothetical protein
MTDANSSVIPFVNVGSPLPQAIDLANLPAALSKFNSLANLLNLTIDAAGDLLQDEREAKFADEHALYLLRRMYMLLQTISTNHLIPTLDYYAEKERKALEK